MTRPTKLFLMLTVITFPSGLLFVTGVLSAGEASGLYVLFPFGAIFLGLFLIFRVMEKEVAAFDAEQRKHDASVGQTGQWEPEHDHACHGMERA